ncbi:MAG: hypothetical protein ACQCN3_03260 [Candidatus Bathyarchaeia archaeon]|jgi:hypothetical protein
MNPQKRNSLILVCTAAFWVLMIFVPFLIGIDGFDGGYAISFVSFFLAITFGVATGFYYNQALKLDDILNGKNVLAHWTYTSQQWGIYSKKEYKTEMQEKRGLFLVVTAFALFFGVLFWFFDPDAGFYVFVTMLGLIGLIGFTWRFTTWQNYRQNTTGTPEAYISKDAVYLNSKLYCWRAPLTHFDKATLENKRGVDVLTFRFTVFSGRTGPQIYTVRVPVPEGRKAEAEEVARQVNMQN